MDVAKIKQRGTQLKEELLSLARELEKHEENVTTAKVVGTTTSLLAGGLLVGATIVTGGLALLPAFAVAGGLGATAAGAATALGADVVGKIIKRDSINKAQKKWDEFTLAIETEKLGISKDTCLSEILLTLKGGGGCMALAQAFGINMGRLTPAIGGLFLVVDVMDLVLMATSDTDKQPGAIIRKFANRILSEYVGLIIKAQESRCS